MALTGNQSYRETVEDFLSHWALAEGRPEAVPVILPEGVDLTQAQAWYAKWKAGQTVIVNWENDLEIGSAKLLELRERALERLKELLDRVRLFWAGQPLAEVVQPLPQVTNALPILLKALREGLRLWDRANAGAAPSGLVLPLVLSGGFARADLAGLMAELQAVQEEMETADLELRLGRAARNLLQARLRRVLQQYRALVPLQFGEDSITAETLPRLYPKPGHTPDRPQASLTVIGDPPVWQVTWQPMEQEPLKCWQIRRSPGPRYLKNRERVVATLPPDAERLWSTPATLAAGGFYRVYAVLETENERGSRTLHGGPA